MACAKAVYASRALSNGASEANIMVKLVRVLGVGLGLAAAACGGGGGGGSSGGGGSGALSAQWRSFSVAPGADGTGGGARQLMALSGRRTLGGGLAFWADAATAWGDDVDLVRAVQAVPGVVVARHWGDWASEVVAGLRLDAGPASFRAGLARRLPRPAAAGGAPDPAAVLEGWIEARASW